MFLTLFDNRMVTSINTGANNSVLSRIKQFEQSTPKRGSPTASSSSKNVGQWSRAATPTSERTALEKSNNDHDVIINSKLSTSSYRSQSPLRNDIPTVRSQSPQWARKSPLPNNNKTSWSPQTDTETAISSDVSQRVVKTEPSTHHQQQSEKKKGQLWQLEKFQKNVQSNNESNPAVESSMRKPVDKETKNNTPKFLQRFDSPGGKNNQSNNESNSAVESSMRKPVDMETKNNTPKFLHQFNSVGKIQKPEENNQALRANQNQKGSTKYIVSTPKTKTNSSTDSPKIPTQFNTLKEITKSDKFSTNGYHPSSPSIAQLPPKETVFSTNSSHNKDKIWKQNGVYKESQNSKIVGQPSQQTHQHHPAKNILPSDGDSQKKTEKNKDLEAQSGVSTTEEIASPLPMTTIPKETENYGDENINLENKKIISSPVDTSQHQPGIKSKDINNKSVIHPKSLEEQFINVSLRDEKESPQSYLLRKASPSRRHVLLRDERFRSMNEKATKSNSQDNVATPEKTKSKGSKLNLFLEKQHPKPKQQEDVVSKSDILKRKGKYIRRSHFSDMGNSNQKDLINKKKETTKTDAEPSQSEKVDKPQQNILMLTRNLSKVTSINQEIISSDPDMKQKNLATSSQSPGLPRSPENVIHSKSNEKQKTKGKSTQTSTNDDSKSKEKTAKTTNNSSSKKVENHGSPLFRQNWIQGTQLKSTSESDEQPREKKQINDNITPRYFPTKHMTTKDVVEASEFSIEASVVSTRDRLSSNVARLKKLRKEKEERDALRKKDLENQNTQDDFSIDDVSVINLSNDSVDAFPLEKSFDTESKISMGENFDINPTKTQSFIMKKIDEAEESEPNISFSTDTSQNCSDFKTNESSIALESSGPNDKNNLDLDSTGNNGFGNMLFMEDSDLQMKGSDIFDDVFENKDWNEEPSFCNMNEDTFEIDDVGKSFFTLTPKNTSMVSFGKTSDDEVDEGSNNMNDETDDDASDWNSPSAPYPQQNTINMIDLEKIYEEVNEEFGKDPANAKWEDFGSTQVRKPSVVMNDADNSAVDLDSEPDIEHDELKESILLDFQAGADLHELGKVASNDDTNATNEKLDKKTTIDSLNDNEEQINGNFKPVDESLKEHESVSVGYESTDMLVNSFVNTSMVDTYKEITQNKDEEIGGKDDTSLVKTSNNKNEEDEERKKKYRAKLTESNDHTVDLKKHRSSQTSGLEPDPEGKVANERPDPENKNGNERPDPEGFAMADFKGFYSDKLLKSKKEKEHVKPKSIQQYALDDSHDSVLQISSDQRRFLEECQITPKAERIEKYKSTAKLKTPNKKQKRTKKTKKQENPTDKSNDDILLDSDNKSSKSFNRSNHQLCTNEQLGESANSDTEFNTPKESLSQKAASTEKIEDPIISPSSKGGSTSLAEWWENNYAASQNADINSAVQKALKGVMSANDPNFHSNTSSQKKETDGDINVFSSTNPEQKSGNDSRGKGKTLEMKKLQETSTDDTEEDIFSGLDDDTIEAFATTTKIQHTSEPKVPSMIGQGVTQAFFVENPSNNHAYQNDNALRKNDSDVFQGIVHKTKSSNDKTKPHSSIHEKPTNTNNRTSQSSELKSRQNHSNQSSHELSNSNGMVTTPKSKDKAKLRKESKINDGCHDSVSSTSDITASILGTQGILKQNNRTSRKNKVPDEATPSKDSEFMESSFFRNIIEESNTNSFTFEHKEEDADFNLKHNYERSIHEAYDHMENDRYDNNTFGGEEHFQEETVYDGDTAETIKKKPPFILGLACGILDPFMTNVCVSKGKIWFIHISSHGGFP